MSANTTLEALMDSMGRVKSGLVSLFDVDLAKVTDANLSNTLALIEIYGGLVERARRRILREMIDRARVRAMRSSNEGGPPPVIEGTPE